MHPFELVDPPPENEIMSQHLHMLLTVYNQRQKVCFDSRQYDQLYYTILTKFLDTPYSLTKSYHEKYPKFFQDFLYITKLVEIADRIIELMSRNVETRDGLIVKLRLLQTVILCRNKFDKSQENRQIMVLNLSEITIKFMSILAPTLNADVYLNIVVLLWQAHRIMADGEPFPFPVLLDATTLNKLDIWRHFKSKSIIDEDDRKMFLTDVALFLVDPEAHG